MKKLLIYWPLSLLDEIQIHKEIGAIALSATKKNVQTCIVCARSNIKIPTVKIYETTFSKSNLISKVLEPILAIKYILLEKPDCVLMYNVENYGNLILSILLKYFRKKIRVLIKADTDGSFLETRSSFVLIIYKVLYFAYTRFTQGIILETSCALRKISRFLNYNRGLLYCPDGFSGELFHPSGNNVRRKTIICIARIARVKNIHGVIELYRKVKGTMSNVEYIIVGKKEDQSYLDELQAQLREINMENDIQFLEPDEEGLSKILCGSTVLVSLSKKESFGIARMEALGCGIPVVTYDVGCGEDFKEFGAIVVPMDDLESAFKEVVKLLSDEAYWTKMSNIAIQKSLSWDQVVDRLFVLFEGRGVGDK